MASQQQMRSKNGHDEGEIQVTHYESLTIMDSGAQPAVVVQDQSKLKGAGVAKDAALIAATGAMESLNAGVSAAEGVAGTVMNVGKKGAIAGKDITLQTGKATAEYVGKGAAMAAGLASDTKQGVVESVESINAGVARAVEGTSVAVEKGASYARETLGSGKDITLQTGRTAADYVRNAAKEFVGDTTVGVRESMESLNAGVGGVIEETAAVAEMVGEKAFGATGAVVDLGKKGAVAGKTTAEYVSKAGWGVAEMASEAAAGLTTSMESLNAGVGGLVEGTALVTEKVGQKTFDTVVGAGKKGVSAAKDATLVGGWGAVEFASDTAAGVTESMETLNRGVAGLVEGTAAATQETFDTVVNVGKKGASYIGEKAVAGKDITLETGKATTEYVGKGASVVKDAAVVGGWSALELASDTASGLTESIEDMNIGVAGLVENAAEATEVAAGKAKGLKDVVVDIGKKGASYIGEKGVAGKDITMETGKTTAQYVGKAAGVVKDAALVAGSSAAELASETATGVTESMESLNVGVAGLVEGTACVTEGVAQKSLETGKDIALETGKTSAEYVGKAVGVVKDTALAAGRGAADIAIETGKTSADYVGKAVDVAKGVTLAVGRGAADIALETGKTSAEYVGKAMDVAKSTALAAERGAAAESKQNQTAGYVGLTQPKNIVLEREEVTVNYGQKRNTVKETKKVYKE